MHRAHITLTESISRQSAQQQKLQQKGLISLDIYNVTDGIEDKIEPTNNLEKLQMFT